MKAWIFSLALVLSGSLVSGLGCGSDSNPSGVACTSDEACGFGLVCAATGFCEVLPCTVNTDCLGGNQACITQAGAQVCAVTECGCATCGQCPVGETCDNGSCVFQGGGTCPNGQSDCGATEICDGGSCRPCQGAECPTSGCEATGCTGGQVCNTTTHQCETPTTTTANACDTCANVDACGGAPWKCAPLVSGSSCLPPCASNAECQTGWLCQGGNCVPSNFRCDGCMKDGCDAGQACNPNSNACVAATAKCASCGNDWECGAGSACHENACVPRCEAGVCPTGGSCVTSGNQVSVCANACAGDCTPACSGGTPHCQAGSCVACRNAGDCGGGQTCSAAGVCEGQQNCTAPTPIFWNGGCVQCTSNTHCPSGQFCSASNTCGSDVCASCVDPYPACTQIGEDFYCVQCATDTECGVGATCNQQTFACEGGTVTPTEACHTDADCDDGSQTGFVNHCDVASGYCYDEKGGCDNVTAYCPGTDGQTYKCSSLLDLFGGAGGVPLPGGSTIPGSCSCSAFPVSTCRGGSCLDLGVILCVLGGGDFLTCLAASNGTGTCFDASILGP